MFRGGESKRWFETVLVIVWCLALVGVARADWPQQEKLTASDGASYDYFGCSVSISGDYAIVGAYRAEDGGSNPGSAYIFKRNGTGWTQQAKLNASDSSSDDYFGWSVSISEDYAIVGAYGDGSFHGSAYIFKRNATSWSQQAKLTASDGSSNDRFGYSVSISDDYAIVGAYGDASSRGSAYIFKRNGTSWTEQKLTASDGTSNDFFGWSVSISEDYAIVGAHGDGSSRGAAYIFKRNGTTWTEHKLTASDASPDDFFGCSVSINDDYAIVGAYGDGPFRGSAYIFERNGTTWTEHKLTASDGSSNDFFGWSVSISGDYAIVGAYGDVSYRGSAYVFKRNGTTWTEEKLTASDGAENDQFGYSVSNDGYYAIVGAHWDNSCSGSAYTFRELGTLTLLTPNGGENLFAGTQYEISWQPGGAAENVLLEYSTNNGGSWATIDTVANTGSYQWDVPWVNSQQCRVRISDADYPSVSDVSNAVFTIRTGTLTLLTPSGGEELCAGTDLEITWTSGGTVLDVLIEYSTNNGASWTPIVEVPNFGWYEWELPQVNSQQCRVRISDVTYPAVKDTSPVFAIYICELTLQTPNGGEELIADTSYNISWQSAGPIQNVSLEYSINNGTNWTFIDTVTNSGSYEWPVPQEDSEQCLVWISDASYPSLTNDVSDAVFTIYTCTLTADLNNDCWVDFLDYAVFADWWLVSDCGEPDWCDGANLDQLDGVDWDDLDIFCDEWLQCGNPFDPNCLP